MTKILLIDGNNLAIRAAFANDLSISLIDFKQEFNPDDIFDKDKRFPTGVLHGFFRTVAMIRRNYPEHYIMIAWDMGHDRRLVTSSEAVKTGVIPQAYKANRKEGETPEPILNFTMQKEPLRQAISMTNIPQIEMPGEEADDLIASYVSKYGQIEGTEFIILTNDKDYYQLLDYNVWILKDDGLLSNHWFEEKYGILPSRWVDVGALMGDAGDNIFGVPGWGEKTALKAIQEHGYVSGLLKHLKEKLGPLREQFPDLNADDFEKLKAKVSATGKPKWPNILPDMPFTGVAYARERGEIKCTKTEVMALMFEERIKLAYDLKKMDTTLKIPALPAWERDMTDEFREFCGIYRLSEVADDAELLCSCQP